MTQAARVQFLAETCLSRGSLIEDGDDLGHKMFKIKCFAEPITWFLTLLQFGLLLRNRRVSGQVRLLQDMCQGTHLKYKR